jgi:hypothetical protein
MRFIEKDGESKNSINRRDQINIQWLRLLNVLKTRIKTKIEIKGVNNLSEVRLQDGDGGTEEEE